MRCKFGYKGFRVSLDMMCKVVVLEKRLLRSFCVVLRLFLFNGNSVLREGFLSYCFRLYDRVIWIWCYDYTGLLCQVVVICEYIFVLDARLNFDFEYAT